MKPKNLIRGLIALSAILILGDNGLAFYLNPYLPQNAIAAEPSTPYCILALPSAHVLSPGFQVRSMGPQKTPQSIRKIRGVSPTALQQRPRDIGLRTRIPSDPFCW
jgi:hypothetical protein